LFELYALLPAAFLIVLNVSSTVSLCSTASPVVPAAPASGYAVKVSNPKFHSGTHWLAINISQAWIIHQIYLKA
jgi:hypothetical protein